jgi:transketolase
MNTLFEMAGRDPRVCLVVGDLGYSVIEQFARTYPDQFVNSGVAEQDMIGIATGMALSGKIVFTYSIANFATLRCLEQIRNDVCYHRANVKVVAVGGGLAYGNLGISHHATEDLAILRALPEMTVVAPGDPVEADLATRAVIEHEGPVYLRLGKAGEPVVHTARPSFTLGKAIRMRQGRDLTLISTGGMLATAVKAAEALAERGVEAGVLSMHTVAPLDEDAVRSTATQSRAIVTLEEHSIIGGLGGAVAEVLAEMPRHAPLLRIGLSPGFNPKVGDQQYLKQQQGLDLDGVLKQLEMVLDLEAPTRKAKETHGLVG